MLLNTHFYHLIYTLWMFVIATYSLEQKSIAMFIVGTTIINLLSGTVLYTHFLSVVLLPEPTGACRVFYPISCIFYEWYLVVYGRPWFSQAYPTFTTFTLYYSGVPTPGPVLELSAHKKWNKIECSQKVE